MSIRVKPSGRVAIAGQLDGQVQQPSEATLIPMDPQEPELPANRCIICAMERLTAGRASVNTYLDVPIRSHFVAKTYPLVGLSILAEAPMY